MTGTSRPADSERTLILAPLGRDAAIAAGLLREAHIECHICADLVELTQEIDGDYGIAIVTEEAVHHGDARELTTWIGAQPYWSDFPFILLTRHGGGIERNPAATRLMEMLGNVTFLERPFHPTTLISAVRTGLRGRQRQYDCRRLNDELESRVQERTAELAAANRQLVAQIEEREKVETTLRRMQRLEAVGQLTSGVAHDFNNLLTVVLGNIAFVEKQLAASGINGKMSQRLGSMRAAAERGAKLTDQLLAFSRRQRLEPKALDLNEVLGGMHDLLQSTMGGSIGIVTKLQPDLWPAMVDPTQFELAVLNLAINARDAMEVGGSLTVETANVVLGPPVAPEEPPAGEYVVVRVTDNGAGMTDEVRQKVFEPFFTTKEVGKGSGLGLSQVLGFVQQSGGGVYIDSQPAEGTAVFIYLPRTEQRPTAERPVSGVEGAAGPSGASILLVDDDGAVRDVTATMLRELGYHVHEAGSGGAALDLIERQPAIDLLVVDFAMPGMSGADVVRRIRAARPLLPAVFITGYADHSALGGVSESHILGKPFHLEELACKVRMVLAEATPLDPPSLIA